MGQGKSQSWKVILKNCGRSKKWKELAANRMLVGHDKKTANTSL